MKIGIDISQIVYQTGVSRYTKELVEYLLAIDRKNDYILFFSSLRQKIQNLKFKKQNCLSTLSSRPKGNAKLKIYKFPPTVLEFLWNRLHCCKIENFIGKVDIFHSSDWIQPPTKAKKVTTVHDLSFLHYPQTFPKKIIKVQKRRLNWVKKECDLVLADSKATKKDLVSLLGFDEKKIRVVYLGVDQNIKYQISPASPSVCRGRANIKNTPNKFLRNFTGQAYQKLKREYNIGSTYLLYLGTLQPRKNLIRLIEAFFKTLKLLNSKTLKLVIAGKKGWLYEEIFTKVKELGLEDKVIFTGFVSEEEKQTLLKNALCFIYPSLYEGFGIPVLEAMVAGCPVVTSNVSSLPEIAGKAAVLVDPYKVEEIALAIKKITESKKLQNELKMEGLKQVKKFSWEKTAKETLKVYEELFPLSS